MLRSSAKRSWSLVRHVVSCPHIFREQARFATMPLPVEVLSEVDSLFAAHQISSKQADLEAHGRDESYHKPMSPQLVTYPETTEQVSKLLKMCNRTMTPVIPFGSGTSIEGHVVALRGGISLDITRMNKILEINVEDFCCRAQSGVTRLQLNEALKGTGLFFSVDPGADATLGGMMGTRASGSNTVKYGTMRENVLGCTAVLANGDIVKTGSKAIKSSAGYDLTHLLCGSEGTLGVITEVLVKLHPHPDSVAAAVCEFPTVQATVDCVTCVMQHGSPVSRIELLDDLSIACVNSYSKLNLNPCPTLFLEFQGTKSAVAEQAELVGEIVKEFGGSEFRWESTTEGRERLWKARKSAYWATLSTYPKHSCFTTDVCVPISKLAECIMHAKKLASDNSIVAPVVGHVGDGNFHSILVVDPNDEKQLERAKQVSDGIVRQALSCGGTCTGEHGIGHGKLSYLEQEHGSNTVAMMHIIKKALDPNNILNPGKLGSDPSLFPGKAEYTSS